jgi:hypothetical protein
MIIQIYEYVGDVTRSITRARLVTEIEVDEFPQDQGELAAEYGGDFIEVQDEPLTVRR